MGYPQSQHHLTLPQRNGIDQCGLNLLRNHGIIILYQADLRSHLNGNHAGQLQIVNLFLKAVHQGEHIVYRLGVLRQAALRRLLLQGGQFLFLRLSQTLLTRQNIHGQFLKIGLVQLIQFIQHGHIF